MSRTSLCLRPSPSSAASASTTPRCTRAPSKWWPSRKWPWIASAITHPLLSMTQKNWLRPPFPRPIHIHYIGKLVPGARLVLPRKFRGIGPFFYQKMSLENASVCRCILTYLLGCIQYNNASSSAHHKKKVLDCICTCSGGFFFDVLFKYSLELSLDGDALQFDDTIFKIKSTILEHLYISNTHPKTTDSLFVTKRESIVNREKRSVWYSVKVLLFFWHTVEHSAYIQQAALLLLWLRSPPWDLRLLSFSSLVNSFAFWKTSVTTRSTLTPLKTNICCPFTAINSMTWLYPMRTLTRWPSGCSWSSAWSSNTTFPTKFSVGGSSVSKRITGRSATTIGGTRSTFVRPCLLCCELAKWTDLWTI